jgi:hypothetical protein
MVPIVQERAGMVWSVGFLENTGSKSASIPTITVPRRTDIGDSFHRQKVLKLAKEKRRRTETHCQCSKRGTGAAKSASEM